MAHRARRDNLTRRSWLLAGVGIGVFGQSYRAEGALRMTPRLDGEMLYVSAPGLHFLTGKPLDRLRDGRTVTFIAQLSLSLDDNKTILRSHPLRFDFSCDVWAPDKFSVTKKGASSGARKGMSAEVAEAWCLESLAINTSGIAPDRPVWLRLDLRVADLKDQAEMVGDTGLSIPGLIDTLSRKARALQPHWTLDVPPFRLGDLKKAAARGPRTG
jgi:hypothetical protein